MEDFLKKLQMANKKIIVSDQQLAEELIDLRNNAGTGNRLDTESRVFESTTLDEPAILPSDLALETIVLRAGRPVLAVRNNEAVLEFRDADSRIWKDRLLLAKSKLIGPIKAVGRIEVENNISFTWLGTGWLVDKDIIVTNRHVALVFAARQGGGFTFRENEIGRRMGASVDFLKEIDNTATFIFKIKSVLHIEDDNGPDIALLRVEPVHGRQLPEPIRLSHDVAEAQQQVATIGYPARDSRIPEQALMDNIFGNVYERKRLAPGLLTGVTSKIILHDCSTLGGNSGSSVIDINTGMAVGLHFAGRFLESNFAVPANIIQQRVDTVKAKKTQANNITSMSEKNNGKPGVADWALQVAQASAHGQQAISFTIPLQINISLGTPMGNIPRGVDVPSTSVDGDETFFTEGLAADYSDRDGYNELFLGDDLSVPLPEVADERPKKDVLFFDNGGQQDHVLTYRHFSVVMSQSRRQCFFSAANVDGATSISSTRGPWRTDPRIPAQAQILKECYGAPPKFSRGHMTRREDPVWGDRNDAAQGNADSMHVTNTVPQMQSNNGGIWLKLENYALNNARKDKMRISVFTGPVFRPNDPVKFGVTIPLDFWKVIAFIHDDTSELCATGYMISQKEDISGEEFVFGEHDTDQVRISEIEKLTGLSFGPLSNVDPMAKGEEFIDTPRRPIGALNEIKFI